MKPTHSCCTLEIGPGGRTIRPPPSGTGPLCGRGGVRVPTEPFDVVWTAIFGWQETLRLCLIIVVTATAMLFYYLAGDLVPLLHLR